ncbi:hypothetical protein V2A60_003722 [Cordyceps javanica]
MSQPNPYEADPQKIPPTDPYRDEPLYGRYQPQPTDFTPDSQHVNSTTPASIAYWASVLTRCTPENLIYENETGGRDVFALGTVIIKSTHLKEEAGRDYTLADKNEVAATKLAKPILNQLGIMVPEIYFAGEIQGRSVLVQQRIPGVGLNVAWRYLPGSEKRSFKEQARGVLAALEAVKASDHSQQPDGCPSYIVADPDPVANRGIRELEREILLGNGARLPQFPCTLTHNDLSQSNLIVDQGKIVAVVDWEMAGWFGRDAAEAVHLRIRSPSKETYAHLNLPQDVLDDIYFWNDLYG